MTLQFEYTSIACLKEEQQLKEILSQCFSTSIGDCEGYFKRIGRENFRILRESGRAIAGLGIHHLGQFYGGQAVPMAGIAAVSVAPEYRGKGAAYELLRRTIVELHSSGIPISALYPATQVLYRKVGYEQGGTYGCYSLPTASIQLKERSLPIHRVEAADYKVFEEIHKQRARLNNGNLDRAPSIWKSIIEPEKKETIYAYLIGNKTQSEGYVIFTQHHNAEEGIVINIKDWAVLTTAAAKRFWTFVCDHRSLVKKVQWRGFFLDPLMLILAEQTVKIDRQAYWVLRIIDVVGALSKRGYPMGLDAELHLEVSDGAIASNNGKFCLRVSQGRGEVTKGGKGELQLDIHGLAPLYTGLFTPIQLQLAGYLKGTQKALETATLIFSGSEPWMGDFF